MNTNRLLSAVILLFLAQGILFGRILWLQTTRWREYRKRTERSATSIITLRPRRGRIYDREQRLIATTLRTHSLSTQPKELKDPSQTALALAKNGFGSYTEIKRRFKRHPNFLWIKRHTTKRTDINGIRISEDAKRVYPLGIGYSLIGRTDPYGSGISGLEHQFNEILGGSPYRLTMGKTPAGRLYPYPPYGVKVPRYGSDIVLTIDVRVQSIIEEELRKEIERRYAQGGMVVVINPQNGEIYGMAEFGGAGNRIIQGQYEPGSTFKIVTLLCALEDTSLSYETIVADTSLVTVGNRVIEGLKPHGPLTLKEAVARSSNVGFVNLANIVGKEKLYKKIMLLGFGQKTGIELPGEVDGFVPALCEWTPLRFATISFGQGLSCTFLQLVMAYACIANRGVLMEPHIVKKILNKNGNVIYQAAHQRVRMVVSDSIAGLAVELLREVVREGTGIRARIDGLDIAGKTGTAQKYKDGGYTDDYMSSFIGFFPAYDPSLLIGVLIDEPEGISLGSIVAAPLFKRIAMRILARPNTYNLISVR